MPVLSYSKDGAMRVVNVCDTVYAPNSKGGPKADSEQYKPASWHADGEMVGWSAPPAPCAPRTTTGSRPAP